jgi:hypothetical protein
MSDSESDAPEAVTLSHSAQYARRREQDIQAFATAERQKKRDLNRQRDERLKQQASAKKERIRGDGKGKGKEQVRVGLDGRDEETRRLEARMARAMEDAEDEEGSGVEGGGLEEFGMDDEDGGIEEEDEDSEEDGDEEEEAESGMWSKIVGGLGEGGIHDDNKNDDDDGDEDGMDEDPPATSTKSAYLPDDLFASSLSHKPSRPAQHASKATTESRKKRKRAVRKSKDIIVGCVFDYDLQGASLTSCHSSRIVRTLPVAHKTSATTAALYTPSVGATTPPARVNKFLSRTLALNGKPRKGKGWERKPGTSPYSTSFRIRKHLTHCFVQQTLAS